jgi:pullulanase
MKKALTTIILSTLLINTGCAGQMKSEQNREGMTMVALDKERSYVSDARARWISTQAITWNLTNDPEMLKGYHFSLYYSPDANITVKRGVLSGGREIPLEIAGMVEDDDPLMEKYPYLKGHVKISTAKLDRVKQIPELLRGNVLVVIKDANGKLIDATQIQNYGILDEMYTYNKDNLGVTFSQFREPTLKIWAPTAKFVRLHIFDKAGDKYAKKVRTLNEQVNEGVWTITGDVSWVNKYYLYEVQVYSPASGLVETNFVTDPYSISLAANSTMSQIVELDDSRLKPPGWDTYKKPPMVNGEDKSIYELHVRDFSINDQSVNEKYRGKYLALTESDSDGMKHLKELAKSGLTHVHLLPVADFASVDESSGKMNPIVISNSTFPTDSRMQQEIVAYVKDKDEYNWGYDPYHYLVPEGSYATNPEGSSRILEFRQMIKSLNDAGLRVIMDVVYNHTHSAGQDEKSVLDKIVPNYYYRLDDFGRIQNTSCCPDTATEHNMMEKLMVDSLKVWAKEYKVDGFRFDLMGHHTTANLNKIKEALGSLTMAKDGVDGKGFFFTVKDGNSVH